MSTKSKFFGGVLTYYDSSTFERVLPLAPITFYDDFLGAGQLATIPNESSEEKGLAESLEASASGVRHALSGEDFTGAMAALAGLRRPVDDFFDRVTVNTDKSSLRENRLRLLGAIGATMNQVADFSRIEGGER